MSFFGSLWSGNTDTLFNYSSNLHNYSSVRFLFSFKFFFIQNFFLNFFPNHLSISSVFFLNSVSNLKFFEFWSCFIHTYYSQNISHNVFEIFLTFLRRFPQTFLMLPLLTKMDGGVCWRFLLNPRKCFTHGIHTMKFYGLHLPPRERQKEY